MGERGRIPLEGHYAPFQRRYVLTYPAHQVKHVSFLFHVLHRKTTRSSKKSATKRPRLPDVWGSFESLRQAYWGRHWEEAGERLATPRNKQAEVSQTVLRLNLLLHQVAQTKEVEKDVTAEMTVEALETREAIRGDLVPL